MAQFKATAKNIRKVLEEMSKENTSGYFTPADIAIKLLSHHYGMAKVHEDKKRSTSRLVGAALASMINSAINDDMVRSTDRVAPNIKHFSGIGKSFAYRIGKPSSDANGNIALPRPSSKANRHKNRHKVNGNIANIDEANVDRLRTNAIALDSIAEKLEDFNNRNKIVKNDQNKEILTEESIVPSATIDRHLKMADIVNAIKTMNFSELNEVIMEATLTQQQLYDQANNSLNTVKTQMKAFASMAKEFGCE